ncbi:MAG: hypothetical protein CM15mV90_230 [uncultured marine virus]|nr:MAG: hypothetical protein CM15mV90_230 [uncultured marine virus]
MIDGTLAISSGGLAQLARVTTVGALLGGKSAVGDALVIQVTALVIQC